MKKRESVKILQRNSFSLLVNDPVSRKSYGLQSLLDVKTSFQWPPPMVRCGKFWFL